VIDLEWRSHAEKGRAVWRRDLVGRSDEGRVEIWAGNLEDRRLTTSWDEFMVAKDDEGPWYLRMERPRSGWQIGDGLDEG
jgi:hypothetical protein